MELKGKKALVLGAGKSGVSSARFLARRGAVVALYDRKPVTEWTADAAALGESFGVGLIGGELPSWLLDQIELLVISPGVPTNSIPARYVDRKDGEVIGEIELAYRFLRGRIIAITGTNGKTTTTSLIGKMLSDAGLHVLVGGNIGRPMTDLVEEADSDTITVVEASSFQLETIKTFHPNVAICLNVTPNHLDRYPTFLDYAAAKHRIFMNQTAEDIAILNADNEITLSWRSGLAARRIMFSIRQELDEGFFLRGRELVMRENGSETVLIGRDDLFLRGLHNVENVLAAFAAGRAAGVGLEAMSRSAASFRGVEHRIEFVAEIAGVKFFNDSKATSVDATQKALAAFDDESGKIVLIMGGRGKNAPYEPLIPLIKEKVRRIVAIGEEANKISNELAAAAEITYAESLDEAVATAFSTAVCGDIVLLAPACASFDMFSSFEHRGEVFKATVLELAANAEQGRLGNNATVKR